MRIDLNCDLGEGFGAWTMGDDAAMLDCVTSANVACGFHAGDPLTMRATLAAAKARGVGIGAHPGFDDKQGFGRRRVLGLSAREVEAAVAYQVGALMGCAALEGARVTHVKAHGALSNMACEDMTLAGAIAAAVRAVDRDLLFVVLPLTALERAGRTAGLKMASEVFADRAYEDDGMLMSRARPGSVLHDPDAIATRALAMVRDQAIVGAGGTRLAVPVETICVHGDTPSAVGIARALRARFEAEGIDVAPMRGR